MICAGLMGYNVHREQYGMATFNFMVSLWLLLRTDLRY
jgi:hypothetical protein